MPHLALRGAVPISIHAPHEGERRTQRGVIIYKKEISIHAPHEGERQVWYGACATVLGISIHAPHEGERPQDGNENIKPMKFQSTLPTRGSD